MRRLCVAALDLCVLTLTLALAYEIGFDFRPEAFTEAYHIQFLYIVAPLVLLRMAMLHLLGLYRGFTRYTGTYEMFNIVIACAVGTLALVVFNILSNYIERLNGLPLHPAGHVLRVPWGIVAIDAMLAICGVGGVRMARRIAGEMLARLRPGEHRRVLILGAGDAGEQVARDLLRNHPDQYRPVAFADPDPAWHGRRIHGLTVAGGLDDLDRLTERYRVDLIVIALPRPTPALLRQVVDHCHRRRLAFQLVPDLESVMRGHVEIGRLRPVEIEDLLGRPPVELARDTETSYLRGRGVLVTGAGGSIGGELSRQALEHRPARLVLLGRGENSLYDIHQELLARAGELDVVLEIIICDVRDASAVRSLFGRIKPEVIFHAAAHKHVHFMEAQPCEAIKNNVVGTHVVAQAALEVGAERMIMISTDKAVRPTGVMGATKRVAETIVGAIGGEEATRFVSVRFGNVLGSRGSVIPLFRRQIAQGGPVTVTHPEVTRYFMTIPEAVSLVIEAGAVGEGGEVFLLEMGQPIRIVDLARQLITLSGLEPDRDIPIQFTGLRPGEKLYEELLTEGEERVDTRAGKLFHAPQPALDWFHLAPKIARLESLAESGDDAAVVKLLHELIPDYQEPPPAIFHADSEK